MPENSGNLEPFADIDLDDMSVKLIDYLRKDLGSKSVNYLESLTRLTGGYETFICRFQLSGVDERLSKPLIIRVYAENSHPYQPLKERMVQNTLADLEYPVPAVHGTCTDKTILGNAFSIMDFSEGKTLLDSNTPFDQMFDILGDLHARIHKVDPEPIISKFTEVGWDTGSINIDGRFEWLRTTVNINFPWLNEAVEWLFGNRPNDPVQFTERYLNAYRRTRPLDETNMAYYLTFRNVMALIEGTQGHVLLGHPEVVKMLLASIYEITGVKIKVS
jgi:hypothetical protein